MACKLTYKGQRFDTEQDLFNFVQIEVQNNLLELSTQQETTLVNSYQTILDNGIEVSKLYGNENTIKNKIDSCSI